MTIRTFTAINLNLETIRNISRFQEELRGDLKTTGYKISWVAPANIHITLKFLGDVDETLPDAVAGALADPLRKIPAFNVSLRGIGVFPNPNRPRILWAGVEDPEASIKTLYLEMEKIISGMGFLPEKKDFSPHATIGRIRKGPSGAIEEFINRNNERSFGETFVTEVIIYRSTLTPKGAEYNVIRRIRLGSARNRNEGSGRNKSESHDIALGKIPDEQSNDSNNIKNTRESEEE